MILFVCSRNKSIIKSNCNMPKKRGIYKTVNAYLELKLLIIYFRFTNPDFAVLLTWDLLRFLNQESGIHIFYRNNHKVKL